VGYLYSTEFRFRRPHGLHKNNRVFVAKLFFFVPQIGGIIQNIQKKVNHELMLKPSVNSVNYQRLADIS